MQSHTGGGKSFLTVRPCVRVFVEDLNLEIADVYLYLFIFGLQLLTVRNKTILEHWNLCARVLNELKSQPFG